MDRTINGRFMCKLISIPAVNARLYPHQRRENNVVLAHRSDEARRAE